MKRKARCGAQYQRCATETRGALDNSPEVTLGLLNPNRDLRASSTRCCRARLVVAPLKACGPLEPCLPFTATSEPTTFDRNFISCHCHGRRFDKQRGRPQHGDDLLLPSMRRQPIHREPRLCLLPLPHCAVLRTFAPEASLVKPPVSTSAGDGAARVGEQSGIWSPPRSHRARPG
jgi:hypothetical protein